MNSREEMLAAGSAIYVISGIVAGLYVVPYFNSFVSLFSFLSGLGSAAPALTVSFIITLPIFILFLWASDKLGVDAELAA